MHEKTDEAEVKKVATVIYDMSEDTRIREAARMREKMLFDEGSAMTSSFRKGKQEGMQIGKQEGMQQIINKMRLNGMSEEEINSILELGE